MYEGKNARHTQGLSRRFRYPFFSFNSTDPLSKKKVRMRVPFLQSFVRLFTASIPPPRFHTIPPPPENPASGLKKSFVCCIVTTYVHTAEGSFPFLFFPCRTTI